MKKYIKILIYLCLIVLVYQTGNAQVTHKKHIPKKQTYRRKRESRAEMQLRQGRLHEQQAKEVERVQKKLEKEEAEGH